MSGVRRHTAVGSGVTRCDDDGELVSYKDYAVLSAKVKRLLEAGNAMDNAISELDPQRLERSRYGRMTDAEYVAVMKWRTTKDPNYNRA